MVHPDAVKPADEKRKTLTINVGGLSLSIGTVVSAIAVFVTVVGAIINFSSRLGVMERSVATDYQEIQKFQSYINDDKVINRQVANRLDVLNSDLTNVGDKLKKHLEEAPAAGAFYETLYREIRRIEDSIKDVKDKVDTQANNK